MATSTLTSFAILKVNIDQGNDYLDYLLPFILQVLVDHDIDPITDESVHDTLAEQFGLEIPQRTIEIVLKRISKRYAIKKEHGVYRKIGDLPDPDIARKQAEAERHIQAVIHGLQEFSHGTINPINSTQRAVTAICAFLSSFDIICLRAYLRGTAIPQTGQARQTDITLVGQYVQEIHRSAPERFESFLIVVQGHMLANALLCPDLQHASSTYRNVTFYFDSPLLLHTLGLEGKLKESSSRELIVLLKRLEGRVVAFSHSCQETQGVLRAVATNLDTPSARGLIVNEARKRKVTKSDLLFLADSIEDKLNEAGIEVENTPRYLEALQIDETLFEQVLIDEVSYQNPRARDHDINSVRSIYALRKNKPAPSIEKARAVFVTSNSAFAKAAWEYGQQHESSYDVSSVITSFSLANIAWLKVPMGAPSIPQTQMLAIAYAALQPSAKLLNRFMVEMDRLENQGRISERDHQLLRSSPRVPDELMYLTLGEDRALTDETMVQTLERVSSDITKEVSEKLNLEQAQHQKTRDELEAQRSRNQEITSNLYWRCRSKAKAVAWISSMTITLALVIGLFFVPLIGFVWGSWPFWICTILLGLFTLFSLVFGFNVKQMHQWVQRHCLTWFLRRESASTGMDLSDGQDFDK